MLRLSVAYLEAPRLKAVMACLGPVVHALPAIRNDRARCRGMQIVLASRLGMHDASDEARCVWSSIAIR